MADNQTVDRFRDVFSDIVSSDLLAGATDLAYYDNLFCFGVILAKFECFAEIGTRDWVATNSENDALTDTFLG